MNYKNDRSTLSVFRARGDARLPRVGTTLEREWNGKIYRVEVLKDGFLYRGKRYTSLSSIAKEITGKVWNGFTFFNLGAPIEPSPLHAYPGLAKTAPAKRGTRTGTR